MKFIRKHKKLSIIVLCSLAGFVLFVTTFGKYIYNALDSYILETKGFYFNSNVLSVNTKEVKINNWDGVNDYSVNVDLNNRKNSLVHTESDIEYTVRIRCSEGVTCSTSKNNGNIAEDVGNDSFVVTMVPNATARFEAGDSVEIFVEVESSYPYKKVLTGRYIVSVENSSFSYSIEDGKNEYFFMMNLINSVPYYEVSTAFGTYNVGDFISLEDYSALSAADKEKCFSATVTISFDPNVVYLDMTTKSYLNRNSGSEVLQNINGFNYVNKYTFKIPATSSEKILFYKADRTKDYTYPIVNNNSIINVSVTLAG